MLRWFRRFLETYTAGIPKSEVVDSIPESQWGRADLTPQVSAAKRKAFTDLLALIVAHLPPQEAEALITRGAKALGRADELDFALREALLPDDAEGPADNLGYIGCDWKATEEVQWQADRLCHAHRAPHGWMAPKGALPTVLESLDSWLQRDERRLLYFDMGDSCVAFAVRADQAAPAIALGKKLKLVLRYAGEA